jgi:hypothetical protein
MQRVKRVRLQLMVQLGALAPVPGGFQISIRHPEPRDLDVELPEPPDLLTPRQRFTLAHEIAHTRFYTSGEGVPVPNTKLKNSTRTRAGLEEACNRVAARLLVPKALLSGEIDRKLKDPERIDADFVRAMAARFRASADVMLARLRVAAPENTFARCLLLVRKIDNQYQMSDCYMGMSLLSAFPPPLRRSSLLKWFPELPPSILESDGKGEWQIKRRDRVFLLQKFPLGKKGDFLMQIDDLDRKAPSSKRPGPTDGPTLWANQD